MKRKIRFGLFQYFVMLCVALLLLVIAVEAGAVFDGNSGFESGDLSDFNSINGSEYFSVELSSMWGNYMLEADIVAGQNSWVGIVDVPTDVLGLEFYVESDHDYSGSYFEIAGGMDDSLLYNTFVLEYGDVAGVDYYRLSCFDDDNTRHYGTAFEVPIWEHQVQVAVTFVDEWCRLYIDEMMMENIAVDNELYDNEMFYVGARMPNSSTGVINFDEITWDTAIVTKSNIPQPNDINDLWAWFVADDFYWTLNDGEAGEDWEAKNYITRQIGSGSQHDAGAYYSDVVNGHSVLRYDGSTTRGRIYSNFWDDEFTTIYVISMDGDTGYLMYQTTGYPPGVEEGESKNALYYSCSGGYVYGEQYRELTSNWSGSVSGVTDCEGEFVALVDVRNGHYYSTGLHGALDVWANNINDFTSLPLPYGTEMIKLIEADVAEIILYDRPLNDFELNKLYTYLVWKYDVFIDNELDYDLPEVSIGQELSGCDVQISGSGWVEDYCEFQTTGQLVGMVYSHSNVDSLLYTSGSGDLWTNGDGLEDGYYCAVLAEAVTGIRSDTLCSWVGSEVGQTLILENISGGAAEMTGVDVDIYWRSFNPTGTIIVDDIYPIYYEGVGVDPTPTPVTGTPTNTPGYQPTSTPYPCDWVEWESPPVYDSGGFIYNPPNGAIDQRIKSIEGTNAYVFMGETVILEEGIWNEVSYSYQTVYCHGIGCDNLDYELKYRTCEQPTPTYFGTQPATATVTPTLQATPPIFNPTPGATQDLPGGVSGDLVDFGYSIVTGSCIEYTLPAFDLSEVTLFGIFDSLGISMPEVGWLESDWSICVNKVSFDDLTLGTLDLGSYIWTFLMPLLVLLLVKMIRKR